MRSCKSKKFVFVSFGDGHLNEVDEERKRKAGIITPTPISRILFRCTHSFTFIFAYRLKRIVLMGRWIYVDSWWILNKQKATYIYFFFIRKYRHIASAHVFFSSSFILLIKYVIQEFHLRTRVRQVDVNVLFENKTFIDLKHQEKKNATRQVKCMITPVRDLFQLLFLLHLTDTLFS